jgi:Predicted acyl-CoA transferases/carnitine dehydratase
LWAYRLCQGRLGKTERGKDNLGDYKMNKEALQGIRVVEFGGFWVGPYTAELLAFLGAEVIKIESLKRLDFSREISLTTGQFFTGVNQSTVFSDLNLNKLDVSLDLKQPKAVELAKRIVKISDVLVQNNRPEVMDRLGLGYDSIRRIKPDLIYLSSSARGSDGPEQHYGGFAPSFSCLSGLAEITGYADGPPVAEAGRIDLISGSTNAFAIIAALIYRERTGRGQHIDISSSETISALIGDVFMDYAMNGRAQTRHGNEDATFAPHNCYCCKGDDKWVSIVITNDEEWKAFCDAAGNPQWAENERFCDAYSRKQNEKELDNLISEWTSKHTHYEVMHILQEAGVAAVPSLSNVELFSDPHFKERGLSTEMVHPVIGKTTALTPPWKMSATPPRIHRHSPLFAEHNDYVFGELLGMSSEEIQKLKEEQVIY